MPASSHYTAIKQVRVKITGGTGGEYCDNIAMIIFGVDSEKKAKVIVAIDPAVKTKRWLTYEIGGG